MFTSILIAVLFHLCLMMYAMRCDPWVSGFTTSVDKFNAYAHWFVALRKKYISNGVLLVVLSLCVIVLIALSYWGM